MFGERLFAETFSRTIFPGQKVDTKESCSTIRARRKKGIQVLGRRETVQEGKMTICM